MAQEEYQALQQYLNTYDDTPEAVARVQSALEAYERTKELCTVACKGSGLLSHALAKYRKEFGYPARVVGHVQGVRLGDTFRSRWHAAVAGVHWYPDGGIDPQSNTEQQAYCVALNGGYIDDEDEGLNGVWYTGRRECPGWAWDCGHARCSAAVRSTWLPLRPVPQLPDLHIYIYMVAVLHAPSVTEFYAALIKLPRFLIPRSATFDCAHVMDSNALCTTPVAVLQQHGLPPNSESLDEFQQPPTPLQCCVPQVVWPEGAEPSVHAPNPPPPPHPPHLTPY